MSVIPTHSFCHQDLSVEPSKFISRPDSTLVKKALFSDFNFEGYISFLDKHLPFNFCYSSAILSLLELGKPITLLFYPDETYFDDSYVDVSLDATLINKNIVLFINHLNKVIDEYEDSNGIESPLKVLFLDDDINFIEFEKISFLLKNKSSLVVTLFDIHNDKFIRQLKIFRSFDTVKKFKSFESDFSCSIYTHFDHQALYFLIDPLTIDDFKPKPECMEIDSKGYMQFDS